MTTEQILSEDSGATAPRTAAQATPKWLSRLTLASVGLAMLAFAGLLWAKWGVVLAMSQDVLRFCF